MHRTHGKMWLLLLAVLALVALPALADQAAAGPNPPLPGCNDPRAIARYLNLSETQRNDWKALRDAFRAAVKPLADQIEPLKSSLETELGKPSPNACTAGGFVVQIDALRDQIEAKRADYEQDFEDLLTPEQLTKWHALQTVCAAQDKPPGIS